MRVLPTRLQQADEARTVLAGEPGLFFDPAHASSQSAQPCLKNCAIPKRPSVDEISAAPVRQTVPEAMRVAGVKSWL